QNPQQAFGGAQHANSDIQSYLGSERSAIANSLTLPTTPERPARQAPRSQEEAMTQTASRTQVILATLGVAMALLLAALDQTVVGVAMPRIVSDLHGIEFYAWVTTAYLITSTSLVPVAGKLGDMFGR